MVCVIAILGATATGKSALALDLAEDLAARHDGPVEIINTDSMQLYRGMDIGTAKLPPEERRGVPHHQLDVLDPSEEASVAAYQRHARADVEGVLERGGLVMAVGGSGLYVQALLDELSFPGTDPAVRARLEARAEAEGSRPLHDELTRVDPEAASRIDAANVRRVVRALEVIEITGRPFSASLPEGRHHWPTLQLGLTADLGWIDDRIGRRTALMLEAGLIDEVASLGTLSRTAERATGYRETLAHIRGELTRADLEDAISLATRQLVRRQNKWFRRDVRTVWLPADEPAVARERALAVCLAESAP